MVIVVMVVMLIGDAMVMVEQINSRDNICFFYSVVTVYYAILLLLSKFIGFAL